MVPYGSREAAKWLKSTYLKSVCPPRIVLTVKPQGQVTKPVLTTWRLELICSVSLSCCGVTECNGTAVSTYNVVRHRRDSAESCSHFTRGRTVFLVCQVRIPRETGHVHAQSAAK